MLDYFHRYPVEQNGSDCRQRYTTYLTTVSVLPVYTIGNLRYPYIDQNQLIGPEKSVKMCTGELLDTLLSVLCPVGEPRWPLTVGQHAVRAGESIRMPTWTCLHGESIPVQLTT